MFKKRRNLKKELEKANELIEEFKQDRKELKDKIHKLNNAIDNYRLLFDKVCNFEIDNIEFIKVGESATNISKDKNVVKKFVVENLDEITEHIIGAWKQCLLVDAYTLYIPIFKEKQFEDK